MDSRVWTLLVRPEGKFLENCKDDVSIGNELCPKSESQTRRCPSISLQMAIVCVSEENILDFTFGRSDAIHSVSIVAGHNLTRNL